MKAEKQNLLNLIRLPARLDDEQTAILLGFQKHDIPLLIRAGVLKPLGKPANNATKYFASYDVQKLSENSEDLEKATNFLYRHWQRKNKKQKQESSEFSSSGNVSALN